MSDDPASNEGLRWEIRRSLVKRLGIPWEGMGDMAKQQRAEAAMQISTMMDEIEAWRQTMKKADRDIEELRNQLEVKESSVNHLHIDRNNLLLAVERLSVERDEARRERDNARRWICRDRETSSISAQEIADANDWTCFEEEQ